MRTYIRSKLTYANVAATMALFVALGGTGYAALTLPRDSVGSAQIRAKSVANADLRSGAANSRVLRNRSVKLRDIARRTRRRLKGERGPMGPAGPAATAFRAAVSSGGAAAAGNSRTVEHLSGTNEYRVDFGRDLAGCIFTATLAAVQAGPVLEQPQAGRITVAAEGQRVVVRTYAADGSASEQPFHLSLDC